MDEFARPQWIRGRASRQAHADLPEGTVEEEHGREGFSGAASHLYRLRPPTGWSSIDGPLRPHALDANQLPRGGTNGADGLPVVLLENTELRIGWWGAPGRNPGMVPPQCRGRCPVSRPRRRGSPRDRVRPPHLPGRATTSWCPGARPTGLAAGSPTRLLTVEALGGSLRLPDRGLLGRHALFDPAVLEVPDPEPVDETGEFPVKVLREGRGDHRRLPAPSLRRGRAGRATSRRMRLSTRRLPARDVGPLPHPAVSPHHLRGPRVRGGHVRPPARWRPTRRCCGCPSTTATSTTTR